MSDFTDRMERKAEGIADQMEREKIGWQREVNGRSNLKPWYSSRSVFKSGVEIVLMSANPAGDPNNPPADTGVHTYQRNLDREGFNAYLHESWDDYPVGKAPLQCAVSIVFQEIFGHCRSETTLLQAACFDLCPIRTRDTKESNLPETVWKASVDWSQEVLDHLRPNIIVCVGNGNQRSAWSAVRSIYDTGATPRTIPVKKNFPIKYGVFRNRDSDSSLVIGLPHLSRFATSELFRTLRIRRTELHRNA